MKMIREILLKPKIQNPAQSPPLLFSGEGEGGEVFQVGAGVRSYKSPHLNFNIINI